MVAGNIPGRTQTLPLAIYDAVQNRDYAQANTMVLADDRAGFPQPVGRAAFRARRRPAHGGRPWPIRVASKGRPAPGSR